MDNLLKELKKLQESEKEIKQAIEVKKQEICDKYCPVNIGDTVEVNYYSHNGKKMIIDRVKYEVNHSFNNGERNETSFVCSGYVLRKDGTKGDLRAMYLC